MELPFTLTHPEPEHKVICGMVTLPRRKSTITSDQRPVVDDTNGQPPPDNTAATGNNRLWVARDIITNSSAANAAVLPVSKLEEKEFDTSSIHGVVDHNLITFDTYVVKQIIRLLHLLSFSDGGIDEDTDFVFEEFVRLRVAGTDDNAETDA